MMNGHLKVRQIKSNMTEVYKKIVNGKVAEYFILVSYKTPVVIVSFIDGKRFVYINAKHYSATTTRHINYYLKEEGGFNAEQIAEFPRLDKYGIKDEDGNSMQIMM